MTTEVGNVHDFKVVVAGPFASGKTTMINAISDQPVVGTEQPTSGTEASVKGTTTVGMEYGCYSIHDVDTINLYLYGVPGQPRFSFMWDIVGEGLDGVVVLVDATEERTWHEAANVGRHFRQRWDPPMVVAVNRAADRPGSVAAVQTALGLPGAVHVGCDVTDRRSAAEVLVELLLAVMSTLDPDEELVR